MGIHLSAMFILSAELNTTYTQAQAAQLTWTLSICFANYYKTISTQTNPDEVEGGARRWELRKRIGVGLLQRKAKI